MRTCHSDRPLTPVIHTPHSHPSFCSEHLRLPTQRRPWPTEAPFREPENGLRSYSRCARTRGE